MRLDCNYVEAAKLFYYKAEQNFYFHMYPSKKICDICEAFVLAENVASSSLSHARISHQKIISFVFILN